MVWFCLGLVAAAFGVSAVVCAWMLRRPRGGVDVAGAEAHKNHERDVPCTGGVGIAAAVLGLMAGLLVTAWLLPELSEWTPSGGLRTVTTGVLLLLGSLLTMHVLGRVDDARPVPAKVKLLFQLVAAGVLAVGADMRVLQLLDAYGPAGYAASVTLSVVWIVVITNAFNMLDNMDGLSAGVAAVCAAIFLGAAVLAGQWFVGGAAALLLGAVLGFLVFNFPPAKMFMGDGGSLVVGMLMAVIAIRTTYVSGEDAAAHWHAVLTPLVVLAVPLYDFVSVVGIRLRQGRRPWVGDNQHFSHRLVKLGLSKRRAVGVIYLAAVATGLSGLVLGRVEAWQGGVLAGGCLAVLAMIALLEHGVWRRDDSGGV